MSSITKYIENLENDFLTNNIDLFGKTNDQKLMYLYAFYHYFNADPSRLYDVLKNDIYQLGSDDMIGGIYIDEEADEETIDVICPIFVKDSSEFDLKILGRFETIEDHFIRATRKAAFIRLALKQFLEEKDELLPGEINPKPVNIKIVSNYCVTSKSRKTYENPLSKVICPKHNFVNYEFVFGDDIVHQIEEIMDPREFVSQASVNIDDSDNIIRFGKENSLIVNVSAASIHSLYENYGYRGLFAQNLRYYVANAKIDGEIIESIQRKPDQFWYFNNGIIIICDDYVIDKTNNSLKLSNFSIINGGQTTKLIGETEFDIDFYLQCKIIKNRYEEQKEKDEFISNVAYATNSQKPIKAQDLIANRPELRSLKRQLAEEKIFCQIKRGEKVNKKIYKEPWQNTKSDELGQLILAFVYQKPGTARSARSSIGSNQERFREIFGKIYNTGFLKDLLMLKGPYKKWTNNVAKDEESAPAKIKLSSYGLYFTVAVIGLLAKFYYLPELYQQAYAPESNSDKLAIFSRHDIDHHFLRENLELDGYFELFDYVYKNFYFAAYDFAMSDKMINNYSNFTKTNSNYEKVFYFFFLHFNNGVPEADRFLFDQTFHHASEEELERDKDLVIKYASEYYRIKKPVLPKDEIEYVANKLKVYRANKFKALHIRSYEVFKDTALKKLSEYVPDTLDDLRQLNCLDDDQLNDFGEEIIRVISDAKLIFETN